ncbi:ATP-binding cassette sub-family B member 10, mitochondrial [Hyalella azteca]|uniref:ATP-binding cassette sub-family B member 10, mitochondrial n=1 Tax=Hyalella azteca TaxID=294128 RepID=A0A8B7NPH6_HYAAZ|nr:ATP-binding cassette sub-family B member 10, mitochondrial [Hyalella azteca]
MTVLSIFSWNKFILRWGCYCSTYAPFGTGISSLNTASLSTYYQPLKHPCKKKFSHNDCVLENFPKSNTSYFGCFAKSNTCEKFSENECLSIPHIWNDAVYLRHSKSAHNLFRSSCLLHAYGIPPRIQIRHFKSPASNTPASNIEAKSVLTPSTASPTRPQPRSIKRLLDLAAPEFWSLSGGIALMCVSSAVTMSVPFIIGTLIDTIYSTGGAASSLFNVIDTITSSSGSSGETQDISITNNLNISETAADSTKSSSMMEGNVSKMPVSLEKVCAVLAGVFVIGGAANCGRVYLMTTAGQRISQSLRSNVFSSLLRQETAFFDRSTVMTITAVSMMVSHVTSNVADGVRSTVMTITAVSMMVSHVTSNVADGVRSTVMTITAVSMMVYTSPELSLFGLSVVPPVALLAAYHGRKLRATATAVQEKLATCTQHAEERLSNVRTVRVFAQEEREMRAHDQLLQGALSVMYSEAKMRAAFFGLTGLTGNMIVLSVLYKGSSLVASGVLSVGSLSAFLMYAGYVGLSVSGLTSAYSELSKGAGAADRLLELMDRQPLMPYQGGLIISPGALEGSVEFRDVHFSYPTRPQAPIFRGLNLLVPAGWWSVPAGACRLVVCACWCLQVGGLCLLVPAGWWSVPAGACRLVDCACWCLQVGGLCLLVPAEPALRVQEPVLFSTSIRDNLLYGSLDPSSVTEAQLQDAARQANALEFINKFPKGMDTVVGERGVLLSGGQRQRLAIARALISGPKILCLDEATSALDSESEHLVQEAIERLMQGRTVLTIAHRLSTIRTADVIAVLQDGQVAELGSYADLISRQHGAFRRLISRQAGANTSGAAHR